MFFSIRYFLLKLITKYVNKIIIKEAIIDVSIVGRSVFPMIDAINSAIFQIIRHKKKTPKSFK